MRLFHILTYKQNSITNGYAISALLTTTCSESDIGNYINATKSVDDISKIIASLPHGENYMLVKNHK